jgi:hypothetical protein
MPTPNADVSLSAEQTLAAKEAFKALGRIEAAVEVGVAFQQYTQLVIDAKAAVNEATRLLPASLMSTNLTEAMDEYASVASRWSRRFQSEFERSIPQDFSTQWKMAAISLRIARREYDRLTGPHKSE